MGLGNRVKRLLHKTAAEVVILGLAFGAGAGVWSVSQELKRNMPLSFSEVHHLEQLADRRDKDLEDLNEYYPKANVLSMKIFEDWNRSAEHSDRYEAFARRLDKRIGFPYHQPRLVDLFDEVPQLATDALRSLSHYASASKRLGGVNSEFHNSWKYTYTDDIDCDTDSDGNEDCWCDSRDHYFKYKKSHGENASKLLETMLRDNPDVEYSEDFVVAKKTEAEGEWAAERSRGDKRLKRGELIQIANYWFSTNVYRHNNGIVERNWDNLPNNNRDWARAKLTARSRHYNTWICSSHPGPEEYQVAQRALSRGKDTKKRIDRMLGALQFTRSQTPILEQDINTLIEIAMPTRPETREKYDRGDLKNYAHKVLSRAQNIHQQNFPHGYDVAPVRKGRVLYTSLVGLLFGAVAGWGLDIYGKRKGWWSTYW